VIDDKVHVSSHATEREHARPTRIHATSVWASSRSARIGYAAESGVGIHGVPYRRRKLADSDDQRKSLRGESARWSGA